MTETAVLTPPTIRTKPERFTTGAPIAAPSAPALRPTFWAHVTQDPWLVPKLAVMALVATPQTYAICMAASSESAGVMLGIVPDMLATIIVAWGMIGCLLFLDGYIEKNEAEGAHA